MNLEYSILEEIGKKYGEAFYILDEEQFRKNFSELQGAFRNIYEESYIAYSYKTNYIPRLCKIVDEMGGYAEVVSDMEVEIAKRIGVSDEKIIFNGPYKEQNCVKEILLNGGCVNIDSIYELEFIQNIAKENPDKKVCVGIRCNFDIDDGNVSRFGIDVKTEEFEEVLNFVKSTPNVVLKEMHCHFATRSLKTWPCRAEKMLRLVKENLEVLPEHIDLGGGIFGKMPEMLKKQFDSDIPSYEEYARSVAKQFQAEFENEKEKPKLFIEPGSALVGDCMKFVAKVVSIKSVQKKSIATVLGSMYNINPTLNKKNPPIEVYYGGDKGKEFESIDIAGFTCIESDYLYRGYKGRLEVGDYVVFGNVGSYSIVLKPPFILPNFAIIEIEQDGDVEIIKEREVFDDLFHTFQF